MRDRCQWVQNYVCNTSIKSFQSIIMGIFLINRNGQRIMIADMAKFYTFLYQQKMLPIINALLHLI